MSTFDRPLTKGEQMLLGLAVFLLVIGGAAMVTNLPPSTVYSAGIGMGVLVMLVKRWAEG